MIYLLITILFLFCLIEFIKTKKILSPTFVFNFIWFITLFLYEFKLSYLQQNLSNRTVLIFFACVFSYNITILFCNFMKLKLPKFKFNFKLKKHFSSDDKLKIAKWISIIVFIIEVIYSGGAPLIWKFIGSSKTYFDFGIPSLNGAFYGLIICLGAYSLFKKKKDSFIYLLMGILMISRQVIISIIIEALVVALLQKTMKLNSKKIIILLVVLIMGFSILGNLRSGANEIDNVFYAKEHFEELPRAIKWGYSYMTFSISNFNQLVSITNGGINHGSSMLSELVPTVLLDIVNIHPKYNPYFFVLINFNVSTYLPSIYLDFGIIGIALFNIIIAFLGYILYSNCVENKNIKNSLLYGVFVHNIIFLFFNNMFLYLPIIIQFVYILILFGDKKNDISKIKNSKKTKVSIVVPVYNSSKYLDECIKSICNQTHKNLEIILIDDGSTDDSKEICRSYANNDKRIKFYSRKNSGVSNTRNFGISNATGDYIAFVDSDDFLKNDFVEIMLKKGCNKDIIQCNFTTSGFDSLETKTECKILKNEQMEENKKAILSMRYSLQKKYGPARNCWCKLIKLNLLKKNNIKFHEDIYIFEDGIFMLDCIANVKDTIILSDTLYYYRQNNSSICHRFNPDLLEQGILCYEYLLKNYKDQFNTQQLNLFLFDYIVTYISRTVTHIENVKSEKIIEKVYGMEIYNRCITDLNTKDLNVKEKVVLFLLKIKKIDAIICIFKIKNTIKNKFNRM